MAKKTIKIKIFKIDLRKMKKTLEFFTKMRYNVFV